MTANYKSVAKNRVIGVYHTVSYKTTIIRTFKMSLMGFAPGLLGLYFLHLVH